MSKKILASETVRPSNSSSQQGFQTLLIETYGLKEEESERHGNYARISEIADSRNNRCRGVALPFTAEDSTEDSKIARP